jgi:hypothetical protein
VAVAVIESKPKRRLPTEAEILAMSPGQRAMFAAALEEMARRGYAPDGTKIAGAIGPKTDEELLDAVEELTGHRIPRVAVCTQHGHVAPAKTFCDLYFERVSNVLWIGNRGGGKTANSGTLHGVKARYNDGYKTAIAGAVEKQGYRAYAEYRRFIRSLGAEIVSTILSKTAWVNGAETEVLGGTVKQLNGPHPHLAQMDEVELTTQEAFEEFLNMAQGDGAYDGQQLLTSTRKKAYGIVQGIVKECLDATKKGDDPPWVVNIFCVFETMRSVPNCRTAPENKDKPESELCRCNRIRKGVWDDGTDRSFDQVCGGRAYRADGFVQLKDVHKRFKQLSRFTWEAQQECLTPELEGVVHKWMTERCYLVTWLPHAEFGPIYRGWDWGGNNPNAVVWFQRLSVPVGLDSDGLPILSDDDEDGRVALQTLLPGTLVQFDEIYKTSDELPGDGGYSDLATFVAQREVEWREFGFDMKIEKDFCDPAGFIAKREVRKEYRRLIQQEPDAYPGIEIPDFTSIPAPVQESVRLHISWGEAGKIRVAVPMVPKTLDEYDAYHWPDKRQNRNPSENPVEEDDHAMDATRYMIWNLDRLADRDARVAEAGRPTGVPRSTGPEKTPRNSPFEPPATHPSESPVATSGPTRGAPGRMRQQTMPSVRQVAGRPGFR